MTLSASVDADRGRSAGLAAVIRRVRGNPELVVGLVLCAAILVVALFPFAFTERSPLDVDVAAALQPPSAEHWFGADDTGRDLYARVIYGTRVTLGVVAGSLLASAVIGGFAGLLAGFTGRALDLAGGRLVDVILSFPPIILGVVITGVLGPAMINLMLALSIVYVPMFYRIARAGALGEAEKTYVEAARCLGVSETAILFRHVLRNVLPLVLLQYMILFPLALQIEAALGFLGLGVQPPTPDWGSILEQGKNFLLVAPWISIYPGLAVLVTALAVILLGRGLQKTVHTA